MNFSKEYLAKMQAAPLYDTDVMADIFLKYITTHYVDKAKTKTYYDVGCRVVAAYNDDLYPRLNDTWYFILIPMTFSIKTRNRFNLGIGEYMTRLGYDKDTTDYWVNSEFSSALKIANRGELSEYHPINKYKVDDETKDAWRGIADEI
jgi:hypothetical protein